MTLIKNGNYILGNSIKLNESNNISFTHLLNYIAQVSSILNSETDFIEDLIDNLLKETEAQQIVHRILNTLHKISIIKLQE